jgi:hypothetical protein
MVARMLTPIQKAVNIFNNQAIHHQAVALKGALTHPEIRCVGKSIGFAGDAEVALFHQEQQKTMIAIARKTTREKGRPTNDRRSFS